MAKKVVEFCNVCFQYEGINKTEALNNISFDVEENEFICILGPSGCGKSTLLKLLAGIKQPTDGKIVINNRITNGINDSCGMMFQSDSLFEWMSVRRNIGYSLQVKHIDKQTIEEKTNAILQQMGLLDFSSSMVYELSGGMRQRVSIGRTLINEPQILLMDEPFSALDAFTREEQQDFLRDIWLTGNSTILFVTHDIDEALVLASRVIILSERPGQIVADFKLDYTYKIHNNSNSRKDLDNNYFQTRRKIYELIGKKDN